MLLLVCHFDVLPDHVGACGSFHLLEADVESLQITHKSEKRIKAWSEGLRAYLKTCFIMR